MLDVSDLKKRVVVKPIKPSGGREILPNSVGAIHQTGSSGRSSLHSRVGPKQAAQFILYPAPLVYQDKPVPKEPRKNTGNIDRFWHG